MRALSMENGGAPANSGTTTAPRKKAEWTGGHKRCPIAAALALEFGLSPLTLERQMRGWNHAVAKVLRTMRALGADKRADAYVEPILRANDGREPPPDCPATWDLAQTADAREEVDESRYLKSPTIANRAKLIASSREEIRRQQARLDMLVDEQWRAEREQERLS